MTSNTPETQALLPVTAEARAAAEAHLPPMFWKEAAIADLAHAFTRFERDTIARHRQSSSNAGGVAWQPIDTAPMTGETILAICASAYTPTAFDTWWQDGWTHYSRPDGKWHGGVGKWFPTHWMPRETYLASLSTPTAEPTGARETVARVLWDRLRDKMRGRKGGRAMPHWDTAQPDEHAPYLADADAILAALAALQHKGEVSRG